MKRLVRIALVALMMGGCGGESSSNTEQEVPDECGGCSLPPTCNPDGTAPSDYPPCSCGCLPGQQFTGGVCNDNGCIVPMTQGDASVSRDASETGADGSVSEAGADGSGSEAGIVDP